MTELDQERQRLEAYRQELGQDPRSMVFVALVEALNHRAEFDEASRVARAGLEVHPDSVAGRLGLAVAESGRGNIRDALDQIKAALLIDHENPRALALMGSLLLQKGLARRAVQFLSQATRLAPESREYADLLRRAKRLAKEEAPSEPKGTRGGDAPDHESIARRPPADGAEPTELASSTPEATDSAVEPGRAALQRPGTGESGSSRPSSLIGYVPPLVGGGDPEERTNYDVRNLLRDASARPPSQGTIHSLAADLAIPEGEHSALTEAPTVSGVSESPVQQSKPPSKVVPNLPAFGPRLGGPGLGALGRGEPAANLEGPPREPLVPLSSLSPAVRAVLARPPDLASPAPPSRDDRPMSQVIDQAIEDVFDNETTGLSSLALLGASPGVPPSPKKGSREELRSTSVAARRKRGLLRTVAYWAVVGAVAGAFAWYTGTRAGSRLGGSTFGAAERLRGLVHDLERGGLAALSAAEATSSTLLPRAPNLAPLLRGIRAEARARIWAEFGGSPALHSAALEDLGGLSSVEPTMEVLTAGAALATSTTSVEALQRQLAPRLSRYPRSPKAWVLKARLLARAGQEDEALRALYTARALHPQRRGTLLEIARWQVAQGAYPAALQTLEDLIEVAPNDVEAWLLRHGVGSLSGKERAGEHVSAKLSALLRGANPEVAEDERGRVALALSVDALSATRLKEGMELLAIAERSYADSPTFKLAVGRLCLTLGEWQRAGVQLQRALELGAPPEVEIDLALAHFAERAELPRGEVIGLPQLRPELGNDVARAVAELPYGTVALVPSRFELIKVQLNATLLPVVRFEAPLPSGEARADALAARVDSALAERKLAEGRLAEAKVLVAAAKMRSRDPWVRLVQGRVLLALGNAKAAVAALKAGLASGQGDPVVQFRLAEALADAGEAPFALALIDQLLASGMVSARGEATRARILLSRGDLVTARQALEVASSLEPLSALAVQAKGELLHRLGEPDAALSAYRQALELAPTLARPPKEHADPRNAIDLYYLGRTLLDTQERAAEALLFAAVEREDVPIEARFFAGKLMIQKPKTKKQGRKELELFRRGAPEGPLTAQADRLLKGR